LETADLSRFISCGRRMSPELDKKKASKSGLPAMVTRNYQNAPMNESCP